MAILGDDGRGYELARKLESSGVWLTWLGEASHAGFVHSLASPAAWEDFMRPDDSKSKAQIQLQLRARALLFDKASVSLFLRSPPAPNASSSSLAVAKLNPCCLQLHGDDVYFTLDSSSPDSAQQQDGNAGSATVSTKNQSKSNYIIGSRYNESEVQDTSQRFRNDELPETWYNQFNENYKVSKSFKASIGGLESNGRTPEDMSTYLKLAEKHKRKRALHKDDQYLGSGNNTNPDRPNPADEDTSFLPEIMFTWNCVPDNTLPTSYHGEDKPKVEVLSVFDTLPKAVTKSAVMIERLGLRPEYLNTEHGGNLRRGKNGSESSRKYVGHEQALVMSKQVVARLLANVGFESASELPMDVLSQSLGAHVCKLGRILKVLADSYKKQCSAVELIKMFLQVARYSNIGALAELVKDGSRSNALQSQQQMHELQMQFQPQQQGPLRLAQQIPRQLHPQMQMFNQQSVSYQQHQMEFLRRRQVQVQQQQLQQQQQQQQQQQLPSIARNAMDIDKRPMVQVKLENPAELPMDNNNFNSMNLRNPQMQFRQQLAAMGNIHSQQGSQFRQLSSMQVPQMQQQQQQQQPQSMSMGMRAQPVKVEGFQELMGGDTSSMKHDLDENKLTPQSK